MRHFTILIFLTLRASISIGQIANDDLSFFSYTYDKDILSKNKVETVTIETVYPHGRKSSKSVYHFDRKGLLVKQVIQNAQGKVLREFYFKTDLHNNLISRIQNDYEYRRIDTVIYFKVYDNGNLIKDSSSELPISYCYEYNSNGKISKSEINSNFGLGNNTKRLIVNTFDSLGRISNIIETVFENENDSTGTLFSDRNLFYYDNSKLEKEVEKLNSKYSWMANKGSIKYVYDDSGNLNQVIRTNAASYTYTYNEGGLVLTKKMKLKTEADAFDDKGMNVETFDKYSYTYRH